MMLWTPKYRSSIVVGLLFCFSFLLRFCLISKGPYHIDCLTLSISAQNTLQNHQLYYQFGTGYPLTVLMGAFFIAVTKLFSVNDPVFAVNLMSVTISSLSVIVFYLLTKNILNSRSAFWGALFFSLHPIFLTLSVYGNSHIICIFFLLLSLNALTQTNNKFRYFFFSLFLGFMGAARLQDMVLMLLPLSFFCLSWHQKPLANLRRQILSLFVYLISAVIIAAAFHAPYLLGKTSLQYRSQFQTFWHIGVTTNFRGFFSAYLLRSINTIGLSTTLPGVLIAWYGLIKMFKENRPLAILAIAWIMVPLFFYGNLLTSVPRFLLICTVPICLSFGFGIDRLLSAHKTVLKFILTLTMAIIILLSNVTHIFPLLYLRHSFNLYQAWAEYIKNHTQPQALVISGDDAMFLNHYGGCRIFPRPVSMSHLDDNQFTVFKKNLSNQIANDVPVYITTIGLSSYDLDGDFSSYIKNHYRLEYRGEKIVEDWHGGELYFGEMKESLYRIYKK